jgi:hypothetical protein
MPIDRFERRLAYPRKETRMARAIHAAALAVALAPERR